MTRREQRKLKKLLKQQQAIEEVLDELSKKDPVQYVKIATDFNSSYFSTLTENGNKINVMTLEEEDVEDEGLETPEEAKKTLLKSAKYHISQNKDLNSPHHGKWRVRREGSSKTIKYFGTQKEAIDYGTVLAEKAGSSIVIHRRDGRIRKQSY